MDKIAEALLGDMIPLEDHIADDVVLTKGNGVMAMFEADGVFPDTADDVDIAAWFDRLHNALKNIAADDVELTIYQCRGEADPSIYEGGAAPNAVRTRSGRGLSGQPVPRIAVFQSAVSGDSDPRAKRGGAKRRHGSWPMRSRTRGPGSTNGRTG